MVRTQITFSCRSFDECLVSDCVALDSSTCVQGNTALNVSGFSRLKFGNINNCNRQDIITY